MPRTKLDKADTPEVISIAQLCEQWGCTEEALRLAIADLYPDFDTLKIVPKADLDKIKAKLPPSLPPIPEPTTETTSPTPPTPVAPLAVSQQQQLAQQPVQQIDVTDLLTRQIGEELQVVDAIAQVRNQLVVNTVNARNSELVETLNQNWMGQKAQYLGTLNGLVELARETTPFTPDTTDLDAEINAAMSALGKKLAS